MNLTLHALQSDFKLRASGGAERGNSTAFMSTYYLTDPAGNKLTDPAGNYLVGQIAATVSPVILRSVSSDWRLHG